MKKFFALLCGAAMALSLVACGGEKTADFDEAALQADAEAVTNAMLDGDFAAVTAKFNGEMAAALDAEKLKAGWDETVAPLGAHLEHHSTTGAVEQEYYAVEVFEKYENNGLRVRVVYDAEGKIAGLNCNYADLEEAAVSDQYTEEEVTVAADETMPLGGTLTLPTGVENPPVVIFVHGSGASDRDENIYGNKPFADIAHGLAERGIASLRYDKRYFTYPDNAQKLGAKLTLRDETLDDVSAAIALMESDERVDGSKVYVLGHSLGGMLTPAIAFEHPELAGVISMAGSLRPLWEISYDQNQEAIAAAKKTELSASDAALLDKQVAQIEADIVTLRGDFSAVADDTTLMGIPAGYWKSLKEYGGTNFIDKVSMPMLILQGDADFQVYPDKDYPLWEETLKGRDNVTFKLFSGLNHLMMPTQGKRDISEYQVKGTVDSKVIASIVDFCA